MNRKKIVRKVSMFVDKVERFECLNIKIDFNPMPWSIIH